MRLISERVGSAGRRFCTTPSLGGVERQRSRDDYTLGRDPARAWSVSVGPVSSNTVQAHHRSRVHNHHPQTQVKESAPAKPSTRKPPKLVLFADSPTQLNNHQPATVPSTPLATSTPLTNGLRPRGARQVSWGPPPPAMASVNQLPYKIDETPESPA